MPKLKGDNAMWNKTEESRQLLAEISKEFISEIAPEELEYADELLEEYHQHPPQESEHDDDPLAFGGDILVAATPVIAMVLEAIFRFLLDEAIKSAKEEAATLVAKKIKNFFNPAVNGKEEKSTLTADQLKKIRELTKKEARRGGMSAKKAEDLALKVVGRLSLAG
jgi:NifB/MoaA-like Fe-S oxidoreductase